jgi:hypothetical protein
MRRIGKLLRRILLMRLNGFCLFSEYVQSKSFRVYLGNRKERFLRVRLNIFRLFLERVVHFQQFLVVLKGHEKLEWHRKNKLQMVFFCLKLKKKSFGMPGEYAKLQNLTENCPISTDF